jgi:phosphotransferase system  glucose/maltose/N-acetylglucosamine-specific IIC component
MKNIFGLNVGTKVSESAVSSDLTTGLAVNVQSDVSGIIKYFLLGLFIFGTIGIIFYILLENKKRKEMERSEEKFWKNMK